MKRLFQIEKFNGDIDFPVTPTDGRFIAFVGYRGHGANKSRVVEVIDSVTQKEIWSGFQSEKPEGRLVLNLDRTGRYLSIIEHKPPPEGDRGTLVELPSGKLLGPVDPSYAARWSPAMTYWINGSSEEFWGKLALIRRGEKKPLVVLGIDVRSSGFHHFNAAGTLYAWGNEDGTVNVADIPEVNRRLTSIGLGW